MRFEYPVQVVRAWIGENISVRVATDVPASRPPRFVTLEALSSAGGYAGVKAQVLSRRRVLVYAWGTDESDAYSLCEQVRELLMALPRQRRGVRAVGIVGEPARRDDPQSGHRRFVMTVDLTMRSKP